jgi:hypothetical protein
MKNGVIDCRGDWLAEASDWGEVAFAEVDLGQPTHWDWLGNFGARIRRERPRGECQGPP